MKSHIRMPFAELSRLIAREVDDSLFVLHNDDYASKPVLHIRLKEKVAAASVKKSKQKTEKWAAPKPGARAKKKSAITEEDRAGFVNSVHIDDDLAASTEELESLRALEQYLLHSLVRRCRLRVSWN